MPRGGSPVPGPHCPRLDQTDATKDIHTTEDGLVNLWKAAGLGLTSSPPFQMVVCKVFLALLDTSPKTILRFSQRTERGV